MSLGSPLSRSSYATVLADSIPSAGFPAHVRFGPLVQDERFITSSEMAGVNDAELNTPIEEGAY